ncbi:LPXTG-motif cell wall anchor domain-containing protein [Clostridium cavendishii DSM 21758]|uniref:LPXTG-motif cell wall anchor domain-containing protein n=1 Tax=Clostridium cavendishii DSM 21758 TaxID=1121302 RepID=A0A1M6D0S2_9CLOT|nr:LPXTG cell wall anchor domain-containing protein [Clostridium cavendishii]SHI66915.1 LPXTG-motif cell wall anchor domain-containing protein [Clostridium cavendishii DSM 21758]
MKKLKRILSLGMAYLFTVTLLPANLVAHAEGSVPKYLETQEGYLRHMYQYKDISVVEKSDKVHENVVSVIKAGKEISKYDNTYFDAKDNEIDLIKIREGNEKVLNLDNNQFSDDTSNFQISIEKNSVYTEYIEESRPVFSFKPTEEGEQYTIVPSDNFNNAVAYKEFYYAGYDVNNDTYILQSNIHKDKKSNVSLDLYKIKGDKLVFEKNLATKEFNDNRAAQHIGVYKDKNGVIWKVQDGYVSKFENNSFKEVYQVDKKMTELSVYDENHMIVSSWAFTDDYMTGQYTIINRDENQNNNDNKPEVKPEIKPEVKPVDSNGNQTIVIDKLQNKDDVNKIEVKFDEKTKEATLELQDINAIKEGKGSIVADLGTTTVNLPFEAIDKSLLVDGAKVLLRAKVEENSDITSKLKGVKKVYNFDLIVKNGDKETSIHQFKNGQAEVTINVSDADLEGLNRDRLAVFYYNEETKAFEIMETKVEGNKITFKTPHFSKYVIAERQDGDSKLPQSKVTESKMPVTGSNINTTNVLLGALVLIVLGGVLLRRRHHA